MIWGFCARRSSGSILSFLRTRGSLFVRKTSAVFASLYRMSRPSAELRSSAMLRFPRLECSSRACTSPPMDTTPVAARPRMASPRSIGSTLITSAPQSASSADAAGTNVCSATSRIRTPFMTGVALTARLPPSTRPARGQTPRRMNLTLTSTSMLDGGHLEHHLAHGLALGDVAQRLRGLGQVEGGPDQRPGPALGQQGEQLGVVAGHVVGPVRREVPELEPEDHDAL